LHHAHSTLADFSRKFVRLVHSSIFSRIGASTKSGAVQCSLFCAPLTRRHLLSDAERRGGPPSHYTLISFCRVLRAGVDPTGIVLKKAMPQYTLSDTECAALWSFVIDS
jgi:hypothetical protein